MKQIIKGWVLGIFILALTPLVQAETIQLMTECVRVNIGDIFNDSFDAPKIKIELENAYKNQEQSIQFELILQDAVWYEREYTRLLATDLKGMTGLDYTITVENETKAVIQINVPEEIGQDKQLSMTLPLLVRIDGNEPVCIIKEKSNTHSIPDSKVLFAVGAGKKATWEVSQLKSYDIHETITMAPITFTEVKTGYISEDGLKFQISLEYKHYQFDSIDYLSVQENEVDRDYIVSAEKYLEFSGGFAGVSNDFKVKRYKNDPYSLYIEIKGAVPSKPGSVTLKNIPIKMVSENKDVEEINVILKGEELVGAQEHVTVAYMIWREEETSLKEENWEEEKPLKEEDIFKKQVSFKLGSSTYYIDAGSFKMDAAPYIELGYMMIPVRYAAEAFGAQEKDIKINGKEIVIQIKGKEIILKKNSNEVLVDGNVIKMNTAVRIKQDRVYIPVGELSQLLGVEKKWDAVTKMAYFNI